MVSKSRLADHQGCYGGVWARRALGISGRLQCGPCPSPATCIQFLGGGGGHAGDGNPLPSQALLLRGPTVEDTAGLQEASQSWKGESLPHNVALRLQLFPALPFPGQQTPYPKGSASFPDPSRTSSYSSLPNIALVRPISHLKMSLLPFFQRLIPDSLSRHSRLSNLMPPHAAWAHFANSLPANSYPSHAQFKSCLSQAASRNSPFLSS